MIARILRASLLSGVLGANLAIAQTSLKQGDLILFNSDTDNPITLYNRANGVQTALAVSQTLESGVELFESSGEVDQGTDGSLYIADHPFSHTLKVDTRFGTADSQNVTVYSPATTTFTLLPDNLAVASDGTVIRVAYSGTQGAVLKHHLDTGTLETLSSGNLLTSGVAAASFTLDGLLVVAQNGSPGNLVMLNGTTQIAMGSSTQLTGIVDVAALPDNKVAITTGSGGVVLAAYKLNSSTQQYDTTFQSLGNFGGSTQWAKTDTDGNLLVSVYYTADDSRILKYDLTKATVSTVMTTTHLNSFAVVKVPVAITQQAANLALSQPSSGGLQLTFSGTLQSSTNLADWTNLSPQPASPYLISPSKPQEFFRALSSGNFSPLSGNILFRGNSYTYGQETTGPTSLPTMLTAIASSLNYNFFADMYAQSGISFKDHYGDANSLAKVNSKDWATAVLQNLSTGPTTAGSVSDHLEYGRDLYLQQIADDPKCHVFLYETPAYRADNAIYPTTFATPDVFQSQLNDNYRLLAKNLNAEFPNNVPVDVVPTGELVQIAGGLLPASNTRFWVQMHATDGEHMSDNRLALTGLAFFVAFTHQNPDGLLSTPAVTALGLKLTVDPRWLEKLVWRYMSAGAYPIIIIDEPQSLSLTAGQAANFSVNARGSGPLSYQWFKDGTAIAGATLKAYSTVSTGGASSTYSCKITNSEGTVQSDDAVLSSVATPAGIAALVDFSDNDIGGADTTFGPAPNDPVNHWNVWKATTDGSFAGLPATIALIRPDGTPSGITLQSTVTGAGAGAFGATSGSPYATNASLDYWYGNTAHPVIEFKATGLSVGKTYDFTFFGSRGPVSGTTDNRQTTYSVTGATTSAVSLDAYVNSANVVTVTGMAPAADGTVTIHITKGSANTNASGFFYLNVMSVKLD